MGEQKALTLLLILYLVLSTLPLVSAAEDSWTPLEPMPAARSPLGVAVVDGKIYAMGGGFTNINEMYDPETDTWTTKTPMPTVRQKFGIAVVENKIYVFGGFGYVEGYLSFVGATEVYDPITDTWETKTPIPSLRERLCASVVNGKIYLIGGNTYSSTSVPFLSDKNEVYDPETDTWETKEPIPNYSNAAFAQLTSAVVDDKIFIMSGVRHSGAFGNLGPTEPFNKYYDPETNTWHSASLMPILVGGAVAASTTGEFTPERIHILSMDFHQIYYPETDTWTTATSMPTPRTYFGLAVVNDELYAIGGTEGEVGDPDSAANERYTPANYIPEFSSWIILPWFLILTFSLVVFRKNLKKLRDF